MSSVPQTQTVQETQASQRSEQQTNQKSAKPTLKAEDYDRISKIEENFTILKQYDDSRFGPVSIIKVPGNERKLMVREKIFGSKTELTTEIVAAQRRSQIGDNHLLAFVDYSTGQRSNFCSTEYWIKLYFEFPDHDIDQELRRRVKSGIVGFNSTELTHMMYQTVSAGAVLHRAGLYHGDIRPTLIEMDNPSRYKLVERFGDLAKPEDPQVASILKGDFIYAAPEVFKKVRQSNGRLKKNEPLVASFQTADVFSLGQALLHAGTDEGVFGIYKKDGSLDLDRFNQLKVQFANRFPENNLLVSTVLAMLEIQPEVRPRDFPTILNELPPYQSVTQHLQVNQSRTLQPTGYNQYVNQNQWEQNWLQGQPSGPVAAPQQPQNSNGVLNKDLHLPHENKTPTASSLNGTIPQQGKGFGVIPTIGTGVASSPDDFRRAQQGLNVNNNNYDPRVNYFVQTPQQQPKPEVLQVGAAQYKPEGPIVNTYPAVHQPGEKLASAVKQHLPNITQNSNFGQSTQYPQSTQYAQPTQITPTSNTGTFGGAVASSTTKTSYITPSQPQTSFVGGTPVNYTSTFAGQRPASTVTGTTVVQPAQGVPNYIPNHQGTTTTVVQNRPPAPNTSTIISGISGQTNPYAMQPNAPRVVTTGGVVTNGNTNQRVYTSNPTPSPAINTTTTSIQNGGAVTNKAAPSGLYAANGSGQHSVSSFVAGTQGVPVRPY